MCPLNRGNITNFPDENIPIPDGMPNKKFFNLIKSLFSLKVGVRDSFQILFLFFIFLFLLTAVLTLSHVQSDIKTKSVHTEQATQHPAARDGAKKSRQPEQRVMALVI